MVEKFVEFFFGPGGVANFDDQRVGMELVEEALEAIHGFGRVVKRKRKLEQDGAEAFGVLQNIEAS